MVPLLFYSKILRQSVRHSHFTSLLRPLALESAPWQRCKHSYVNLNSLHMPLPQEAKAVAAELTHTCFRIHIQKTHLPRIKCNGSNLGDLTENFPTFTHLFSFFSTTATSATFLLPFLALDFMEGIPLVFQYYCSCCVSLMDYNLWANGNLLEPANDSYLAAIFHHINIRADYIDCWRKTKRKRKIKEI